jgi:hypothetical protein
LVSTNRLLAKGLNPVSPFPFCSIKGIIRLLQQGLKVRRLTAAFCNSDTNGD